MMPGFLRAFCLLLAAMATAFSQDRYAQLQQQAAQLYSEQAYAEAHQVWSEVAKLDVPEADRRTLAFYLADSLWRSKPDAAQVAEARKQLEALAGEGEPADVLAAEAVESLGDSWLALEGDWNRAWAQYQRALEYWGNSTDSEQAHTRWLGMIWKATGPPTEDRDDRRIPLEVLEKALRVAPSTEEQARAHFFLGRWYAEGNDTDAQQRAGREYQAAVDAGRDTAVYEAALFQLAEWTLAFGTTIQEPNGQVELRPDYAKALKLFQQFANEFPKGSSRFADEARRQIDVLAKPSLALSVDGQFLPGVKPQLQANWRNVAEVRFTLARVDLAKDFLPDGRTDPEKWLDGVHVPAGANVRQWVESDAAAASHGPIVKTIPLEAPDQPGTYLVEARAGGLWARALMVVTANAAIVQVVGNQAVAFVCDARTGVRATDVSAKVWLATWRDSQWAWQSVEDVAKGGLARLELPNAQPGGRVLFFAQASGGPVQTAMTLPPDNAGGKVGDGPSAAPSGEKRARSVELVPSRRVVSPQEAVTISIRVRGGDGRGVAVTGLLTVARLRWNEAKRAYSSEEIARDEVTTSATTGEAAYKLRLGSDGFYRVAWADREANAETHLWIGNGSGFHAQGVEVIADPAPSARDGKASVIVAAEPGSDVLLLVRGAASLFRAEMVHLERGWKLVRLQSEPQFVPGVLVTAATAHGSEQLSDTKEIQFPSSQNARGSRP
jgi:tetratricopeptide (TPR) repeat protein